MWTPLELTYLWGSETFYPAAKSKNNPVASFRFISMVTLTVLQSASDRVLLSSSSRSSRQQLKHCSPHQWSLLLESFFLYLEIGAQLKSINCTEHAFSALNTYNGGYNITILCICEFNKLYSTTIVAVNAKSFFPPLFIFLFAYWALRQRSMWSSALLIIYCEWQQKMILGTNWFHVQAKITWSFCVLFSFPSFSFLFSFSASVCHCEDILSLAVRIAPLRWFWN